MLQPKKTKYRKAHKGRIHGKSTSCNTLDFGSFGLKALEPDRLTARQILLVGVCLAIAACNKAGVGTPPTAVAASTTTSSSFAGLWSGTTFQGRTISFTVSPDQMVTTLSVGYQIDTCSGTETFADLQAIPFSTGLSRASTGPAKI